MAKKAGPYIGVTGFMSRAEVNEALAMIPEGSTHRLMVGILMSSKTFTGLPNKWPGRYPKKEAAADIFIDDPRALNLIHYNTDNRDQLHHELTDITRFVGADRFDGFQINMRWPCATELRNYQSIFPDKIIVMQVGGGALEDVGRIGHLGGLLYLCYDHRACCSWIVDSILIDPSGGKGMPLNAEEGAVHLRDVRDHYHTKEIGIGIAGGLGPETLHLIEPLMREFPDLSIDAEGRLRTPQPEDALDLEKMRNYLKGAYALLEGECNAAHSPAV